MRKVHVALIVMVAAQLAAAATPAHAAMWVPVPTGSSIAITKVLHDKFPDLVPSKGPIIAAKIIAFDEEARR